MTQDWAAWDERQKATLNPKNELCALCGQIALGSAWIGERRYCHGDSQSPSCYEAAQRRG